MPLTDLQIKNLKSTEKKQKHSVGNSLFLVIESNKKAKNSKSFVGMMRWRDKQIEVRIGVYGTGYK
ncbi:Arm DNA-binding domain-containing protein [Prochlorococcus marinus]|uniref:Arm DNA-binding domain-containing protein n=1 Tax=Prochlorococcus marinus TaxID=1219 RepID=UPI000325A4E3|nr:Arm DNA-binding domain-containing protein [Prochlorococcus marinus]